MIYKEIKKEVESYLKKNGYKKDKDLWRKYNEKEDYYFTLEIYKSNFGEKMYINTLLYFRFIKPQSEYILDQFRGGQLEYNYEKYTDINAIIKDILAFEEKFSTFDKFKLAIKKDKSLLNVTSNELEKYLLDDNVKNNTDENKKEESKKKRWSFFK